MNSENINLIGKWMLLLALVGASIFFAATNRPDVAVGFGAGAFLLFMLNSLV